MTTIDLKQHNRKDNDKFLVFDKENNKLWVVKNFSCPAAVYEYLKENYYHYKIDDYKHYKNFHNYWYDSDVPLEKQVHKKYFKKIKQLLDGEV